MRKKHRVFVYLDSDQYKLLAKAANERHSSLSGLVRQIVTEWIGRSEERDRVRKALGGLSEIREKIQAEHGIYEGNLIEEAREERAKELERLWRG